MPRVRPGRRVGILAAASLLLAASLAPSVAAAADLQARSVGQIFVDAAGRASGQNLVAHLAESEHVLSGFRVRGFEDDVFSRVTIDDFAQAEKIQGVGSSSLLLRGSNAALTLHDNVYSAIHVAATRATVLRYELGEGITAQRDDVHAGIVRLSHGSQGEVGSLVAIGGQARAGVRVLAHAVELDMPANAQAVFLSKADRAIERAAAQGALASLYVTEFEGSSVARSQLDLAAGAIARTVTGARSGVESHIRADEATLLAYDLAYETLPARSPSDVAVYVDGKLAHRAPDADAVLASARAGVASYHAHAEKGRSQVLAAAPSGEHRVSVAVNAQASTESQARAEGRAQDESRVYGSFEHHSNGKLTGAFVSAVLPEGHAQVLGFTALASRTEIFRSVSLDGGASGSFAAQGDHVLIVDTPKGDLSLADDLYATLVASADIPVETVYELAASVKAHPRAANLIDLAGPSGPAGQLILVGAGSLAAHGDATVRASLDAGSRVVYRGAPEPFPSDDAVALALAGGRLGAQFLVGVQESAPATDATAYQPDVDARVTVQTDGAVRIDYAPGPRSPPSFAFDSRGAALAAKKASDIIVTIDGVPAALAASADALLETSGEARYYAETNAEGSLRVLVNTATVAGERAVVTIESRLESSARAAARTDAFGAFALFYDGSAVGSFVTLKVDQAAGAIGDLTMVADNRPVFTSLVAGASAFASGGADGASVLRLTNREAIVEVADTTSGFTRIVAQQETDVAFRLAAGLRAESRGDRVLDLVDADGQHVGSLVVAGMGALEQRAENQGRAHLQRGAQLIFRTHAGIESELSAAQRSMINRAIAAGNVAGAVMVQTQASASAASEHALESTSTVSLAASKLDGLVTSSVTALYDRDIEMATAATRGRVEITIASAIDVGKTLLISLDPDTIPGMAHGKATIKFDGRAVAQASSYADILEPGDDGDVAEYFVLAGDAGTQVLVSIPHFSVHTVTLEATTDHPNSLYMYATILLGVIVVVEGALLARSRMRRN